MFERSAIEAMGARFEIVLEGRDPAHARAAAEAALELVAECDARWSLFRSDSLVSRVNRDAWREPVRLDDPTFELLAACAALREATRSAFDVCVGDSLRALGFRSDAASDERVRAGAFELDPALRTIRLSGPDVSLDLGAIAKGEALDLAAALLRECGVERALMHGGTSSVVALGAPRGEAGWRIALDAGDAPRIVELRDASLSVSAPHGRTLGDGAEAVGHIVDPTTGEALALGARVAVLASSGRVAEAWSTAALVLLARGVDAATLAPADVQVLVCETGARRASAAGPATLVTTPR